MKAYISKRESGIRGMRPDLYTTDLAFLVAESQHEARRILSKVRIGTEHAPGVTFYVGADCEADAIAAACILAANDHGMLGKIVTITSRTCHRQAFLSAAIYRRERMLALKDEPAELATDPVNYAWVDGRAVEVK